MSVEKVMATHSGILAWEIPWTEEPGGLQSMRSQSWTRVKWLSMHEMGTMMGQEMCMNRAGKGVGKRSKFSSSRAWFLLMCDLVKCYQLTCLSLSEKKNLYCIYFREYLKITSFYIHVTYLNNYKVNFPLVI